MIKFIIFAVLFIYLIYKASNFVFKLIYKITGVQNPNQGSGYFDKHNNPNGKNGTYRTRPKGSNVDVEYTRDGYKKYPGKDRDDGEYVDYEEIK